MTISNIEIIKNEKIKKLQPIKEHMDIFIPGIMPEIPNRNGLIWSINGPPGSG